MITKIFILVITVMIIIFDIIVYVKGGAHATISHQVLEWSKEWPVLVYTAGILCGHLLWPQKVAK